jgi:hypothetical protein
MCSMRGVGTALPLDPYCRVWDHPNLFVVDASFLPASAGVNPALTIAAQVLCVSDHIARTDLQATEDKERWLTTTSSLPAALLAASSQIVRAPIHHWRSCYWRRVAPTGIRCSECRPASRK